MKSRLITMVCCLMCLVGCICCMPTVAHAAEEPAVSTSVSTEDTAEPEETPSKAVRIVEFLAIFTVAAGVTAFIVIRPKWKLLKEAQANRTNKK